MEEIREYLKTGKGCLTPEMFNVFRKYDSIVFDGRKIQNQRLMGEFRTCERCCRILRVSALEARSEKYENPGRPGRSFDWIFFENNYNRISCRMYNRRVLFQEVQAFLEEKSDISLVLVIKCSFMFDFI
jgi:hypothetical protein